MISLSQIVPKMLVLDTLKRSTCPGFFQVEGERIERSQREGSIFLNELLH